MTETQCYQLPVTILIETMRGLSATGVLHAHLASLPEGWKEACLADLVIVQGILHTCTIRTMNGLLLLQQEAAFHMLERIGELEWILRAFPTEQHIASPRQASLSTEECSWKGASPPLSPVLGVLPHREKQVLLLLESQKRPEEIARLLQLPLSQVEHILQALASRYMISHTDGRKKE